jgi:nicotinate-nucleotide--dimethylbenzimidazole phosphoribosyltransferase
MDYQTAVEELVNGAAKPPGSLGLLEKYLRKVLLAWETMHDEVRPHHLIFAADNGVVEEGVVAYPAAITYLQSRNMVSGRATISCFCHSSGIPFTVVDVGIDHPEAVGINRKVARGTRNFMKEEAMSPGEFEEAWEAGREMAGLYVKQGCNLLSFGEMGIGNTTTSSAVLHALTGMLPEFVVGYGANMGNNDIVKRKRFVVAQGAERHKEAMKTVEDILRCLGGFDMVAICAAMVECARHKTPFVIDGFITAVAYACAAKIYKETEKYAVPSHLSREPGMTYALLQGNILANEVPLHADMALGEGTGAVLMVSLLKTMVYTAYHTARLAEFDLSATTRLQARAM